MRLGGTLHPPVDGYDRRRLAAWIAAAVLIALHVFPPQGDTSVLIWGFLPWDLAFHIGWMVAAAGLIYATTRFAWRDVDDEARVP